MLTYTALSSLSDRAHKSSALPFYTLWNKREKEKKKKAFSASQERNNGGNQIQEKYTHRQIFTKNNTEASIWVFFHFLFF